MSTAGGVTYVAAHGERDAIRHKAPKPTSRAHSAQRKDKVSKTGKDISKEQREI